jgi:DNA mismatch endonuclease (patch repair protein)
MNRSENMRRIRSKDMRPELTVRSLVHRMGYRFRLHRKDLPGKPDMVFASRQKVIFVHGCYWHGHDCKRAHNPKSNLDYWTPKLARNRDRDEKNQQALEFAGWKVFVVWECEVSSDEILGKRIRAFLGANAVLRRTAR